MRKDDFGREFAWGAATSAYQVEGAHDMYGKGPSIWDEFTHRRFRRRAGNADIACDHYHLFETDVSLLKSMGFDSYRFSISWPRIFPDGKGKVNQKGLDFYKRLIDTLYKKNIRPFITFYHWDMPLALQQKGGFANRDSIEWFRDFVTLCFRELHRPQNQYIILNEPFIFLTLGYLAGWHAPGIISRKAFLKASHHVLLAQAEAGRSLRVLNQNVRLGTTISTSAF